MPEHEPKQCSEQMLQADASSNALYVRTYERTNAEHCYLPQTPDLTLRADAHTDSSLIDDLRAERDHWRAMYDAAMAAARAGITARQGAPS